MKTIYSLLLVLLLVACGCDWDATPPGPKLPAEGTVRIVAQKTAEGEGYVSWKWWITAGTEMQEVLQPENDFLALYCSPEAGSRFWECELVVQEGSFGTVVKPGTVHLGSPGTEPLSPAGAVAGAGTSPVEDDPRSSSFLVLWLRGHEYGSRYVTQEISLRGVYVGGSSATPESASEDPVKELVKVLVARETTVQIPANVHLAALEYQEQDGTLVRRHITLDLQEGR